MRKSFFLTFFFFPLYFTGTKHNLRRFIAMRGTCKTFLRIKSREPERRDEEPTWDISRLVPFPMLLEPEIRRGVMTLFRLGVRWRVELVSMSQLPSPLVRSNHHHKFIVYKRLERMIKMMITIWPYLLQTWHYGLLSSCLEKLGLEKLAKLFEELPWLLPLLECPLV